MSEFETQEEQPFGDSEPSAEEPDAPVAKESGPLPPIVKLLILVAGGVLLVGGAFLLTTKMILPIISRPPAGEAMSEVKEKLQLPKKEKDETEAGEKKKKKKKKKLGPVISHPITGIVANPAGSLGRRIVAFDLMVETRLEDAQAEMIEKEYKIRAALITYFSGWTVREISTREFQMAVRDTVRNIINSVVEGEPVDTVFFTTFLIQ